MRGFTLIELLLVVAIAALMATMSIPLVQSSQVSAGIDAQTQSVLLFLRRAQRQALYGQHESAWSVFFDEENRSVILFKGTEFATRDASFDDQLIYPESIAITVDSDEVITFSLFSATPSASGTVEIISTATDKRSAIIFNGHGKIEAVQ